MRISVMNMAQSIASEGELQQAIRAINRQIAEDFAPWWGFGTKLRLDGRGRGKPNASTMAEMRGDAIIYLHDEVDVRGALGYHARTHGGLPCGFVFAELCKEVDEPWSLALSHEALELLADPELNTYVHGPHPAHPRRVVFHLCEVCDPVWTESYSIDHVTVSNFVLPRYFTGGDDPYGRTDFLGKRHAGRTLRAFNVNPGGYVTFFDPETGRQETYTKPGDTAAVRKLAARARAAAARRTARHSPSSAR